MKTAIAIVCTLALGASARADTAGRWTERQTEGLEQVREVVGGVWSGSAPMSEAAFQSLESLGVKTVISVDGTAPDVERLAAGGMRAVHVPLRYTGIGPIERLTLAKAIRDLPRPIYVHCQHGLHRGPTAAAVALVCTGELAIDDGKAFQVKAGTSPDYPGLYRAAAEAKPIDSGALDAFAAEFDAVKTVDGMREAMSQIDSSWYALEAIRQAGWATPKDHPDLVPAVEAGLMHDAFRQSADTDDAQLLAERHGEGFGELLAKAIVDSLALEDAIAARDTKAADDAFTLVSQSCMNCHAAYRD